MSSYEESFQGTLNRLVVFSPFSFNLLVGMTHIPSRALDTMGVMVKNGRITLMYNPDFFMSLEEGERTFVFIHEMMHVLLHHCTHRCSSDICRAFKENAAMDLAINSLLYNRDPSKQEPGIDIPRYKEDVGTKKKGEISVLLPSMFKFPDGLSFEQYLELLDKKYPDISIKFVKFGAGEGSAGKDAGKSRGKKNRDDDQQDGSGNTLDVEVEISEDCAFGKIVKYRIDRKHGQGYDEDAFIDDYVRNVVENIERNHSWGHLDGAAIEMVKKAQEQPLNWGDILRLKLGPFISFQKQQSRRRWNKHYGKPFLGYVTKSVEPVAVYADSSGSVGSADLSRFIVEVERIANYTGVYLWSFDAIVHDPDEYVFFNRRNIDQIEFKGRGGTSFSPIFEHAKEKNISQIVILTDGYAEEISASQVEGMEVIWVVTKGGSLKGKPGTVIEMR